MQQSQPDSCLRTASPEQEYLILLRLWKGIPSKTAECSMPGRTGAYCAGLLKVLPPDSSLLLLEQGTQLLVQLPRLLRQLRMLQPHPGACLIDQVDGLHNSHSNCWQVQREFLCSLLRLNAEVLSGKQDGRASRTLQRECVWM